MVGLVLKRRPAKWVTLLRLEGGEVQMHFRPATATEEDLARNRAQAAARAMAKNEHIMAEYGYEAAPFEEVWAADEESAIGAGLVMFATELALTVGSQFRILLDPDDPEDKDPPERVGHLTGEDGKPAEWSRRNVAILLGERAEEPHTVSLATRFITLACGASNLEREEGNG